MECKVTHSTSWSTLLQRLHSTPLFSLQQQQRRFLILPLSTMSRLRLRGPLAVLILCLITVSIISLLYLNSNDLATHGSSNSSMRGHDKVQQIDTFNVDTFNVDPSLVTGERIMPELGNATARYESCLVALPRLYLSVINLTSRMVSPWVALEHVERNLVEQLGN